MPSRNLSRKRAAKAVRPGPWRVPRPERRRQREAFSPTLFSHEATEAQRRMAALDLAMQGEPVPWTPKKRVEQKELFETILHTVGFEKALAYVRANVGALVDAHLVGFNTKWFGGKEPIVLVHDSKGRVGEGLIRKRMQKDPAAWLEWMVGRVKQNAPENYGTLISTFYWTALNKALEREAPRIHENFRSDALQYMENRGFRVRDSDGRVLSDVERRLSDLIELRSEHVTHGRYLLPWFEREYVEQAKIDRFVEQKVRQEVNEKMDYVARHTSVQAWDGTKLRLHSSNFQHRKAVEKARAELLKAVMAKVRRIERKRIEIEKEAQTKGDEWGKEQISKLAITDKEIQDDAKRLLEPAFRLLDAQAERMQRPAGTQKGVSRAERIAAYTPISKPKAFLFGVKKEAAPRQSRTASQFEMDMGVLRSEAIDVALLFDRLETSGVGKKRVSQLLSKTLHSKRVQNVIKYALGAGFEKQFGNEGCTVLVNIAGHMDSKAGIIYADEFKAKMGELCKDKRQRNSIVKFLFRQGIIEWHHAQRGAEACIRLVPRA
ncbi:MAG: hypothetical protein V1493_00915 [Candidatus Diapherotrites archaeon]